ALHDYLAVKEGKIDDTPLSRMPSGRAAATRRHSHGRAHGTVPVTVPGTVSGTVSGKTGVGKTALSGERRGSAVWGGDGKQSTEKARNAAPMAPAPASSAAPGDSEYEDKDYQSRGQGKQRRSSKAGATQGTGTVSSFPPTSEVDG
ncbi:unnamed protein product, partial [Laminaria digitata]